MSSMTMLELTILVIIYCCSFTWAISGECASLGNRATHERFEPVIEWDFVNFTWPSHADYQNAVASKVYIPGNSIITGIKYYNDRFYFSLPRIKEGTPVTLAWVTADVEKQVNPLLTPYPNWRKNTGTGCDALRNVQSMEIDRKGIMWVLDGRKIDNMSDNCPPKIVLLDLNNNGRVVQSYNLPERVCGLHTCFLNDIVVDEINGGFAYITDTSSDPGLIVYSRKQNRAWKARDKSMEVQPDATNFTINNMQYTVFAPIDGIALAPRLSLDDPDRLVYYSALSGFNIYAINSSILRNERLVNSSNFKDYVIDFGKKFGQSDGLMMDANGELYFTLLPNSSVGAWDTKKPLQTAEIIDSNINTLIWPDTFAFDQSGNLFVIANNIEHFIYFGAPINQTNFRLLKYHTGTCSYQF